LKHTQTDPSQRAQKFDAWSLDAMSMVIQPKIPIGCSLINAHAIIETDLSPGFVITFVDNSRH